jgi:shikimate kinase
MNIFLIGFMGSGKTTLGKELANALGYKFVDQDSVIENDLNMTINEIFSKHGESFFREVENKTIIKLGTTDNKVIATGGGAPCFLDNMDRMNANGVTVYLKVDPETLCQRLKDAQAHRPLIKEKTKEELLSFIVSKLEEREKFYSQSKIVLQSSSIKVKDILDALKELKYL